MNNKNYNNNQIQIKIMMAMTLKVLETDLEDNNKNLINFNKINNQIIEIFLAIKIMKLIILIFQF